MRAGVASCVEVGHLSRRCFEEAGLSCKLKASPHHRNLFATGGRVSIHEKRGVVMLRGWVLVPAASSNCVIDLDLSSCA